MFSDSDEGDTFNSFIQNQSKEHVSFISNVKQVKYPLGRYNKIDFFSFGANILETIKDRKKMF